MPLVANWQINDESMQLPELEKPDWLWTLLLLPLLVVAAIRYRQYARRILSAYFSRRPTGANSSHLWGRYFFAFFLPAIGLLAVAAANPRFKGKPVTSKRQGGDVVFALDVSRSMLAQDVKPDRLRRAKTLALSLLRDFDNQRVAVVVFAGQAYVTLPFTTNYDAVSEFIDEAAPDMVSAQGSSLSNLVARLIEFFGNDNGVQRGVVVLSDGEDHSDLSSKQVKEAEKKGLIFFPVGIGTAKGAPIPIPGGYLKDKNGQTVITQLHRMSLMKLAGKRGRYFAVNQRRALLSALRHLRTSGYSEVKTYTYRSIFQYFLLPAILLLIVFRLTPEWTSKALLVLGLWSVIPAGALAQDGHKRLLEADKAFARRQYHRAADLYAEAAEDAEKRDIALYNYGVAKAKADPEGTEFSVKAFLHAAETTTHPGLQARALYNAGTLLLKRPDKVDQSIELLKRAVLKDPADPDIRKNLAKALQIKRQQQKQQLKRRNQQNKNQQNKSRRDKDRQRQNNSSQRNKEQQQVQQQKRWQRRQEAKQRLRRQQALKKLQYAARREKMVRRKEQRMQGRAASSATDKDW